MKVRLVWTETTECSAEVDIDAGEYVKWINEGTPPTDPPVAITDTTPGDLKEWFASTGDPDYLVVREATQGARIDTSSEDVEIARVEFLDGEDYTAY